LLASVLLAALVAVHQTEVAQVMEPHHKALLVDLLVAALVAVEALVVLVALVMLLAELIHLLLVVLVVLVVLQP
jgi:hypothetical protein